MKGIFGRSPDPERTALHLLRLHAKFTIEHAGSPLDVMVGAAVEAMRTWLRADSSCLHFVSRDDLDDVVHDSGLRRCAGSLVGMEVEEASIQALVGSGHAPLDSGNVGPFAKVRSWPLRFGGETFAVLNAYFRREPPETPREVSDAVHQLANFIYAGVARRTLERDGPTYSLMLGLLASLLEQKDEGTAGHCDRVLHYAENLALAVGVGGDELRVVRRAALMHDIGKVGVPEDILNHPGALDAKQMEVVREHAKCGENLLNRLPGSHMHAVAQAVGGHHEWYDGGGYPRGLTGDAIPRAARIISICDAFDVMTAGRAYRPAWSHGRATEELIAFAGRQFDPDLVQMFVSTRAFELDESAKHRHVDAV